MVYYLSCINPYPYSIGMPILDDPKDAPFRTVEYADPDSVHWRAKLPNAVRMKQGYPVKPETVPKRILWDSTEYEVPDVIHNQQVLCVCEGFRALVEEFEPGVHQLLPVDVFTPASDAPVARYYWLVVGQRVSAVDAEHTTYDWMLDYTKQDGFWTNNDPNAKLVFSTEKIGRHHLWVDPHLIVQNHGFCSNAFGEAALAAGFSGLNVTPLEEK